VPLKALFKGNGVPYEPKTGSTKIFFPSNCIKIDESDATVGFVNFEDLTLELSEPKFRNIY